MKLVEQNGAHKVFNHSERGHIGKIMVIEGELLALLEMF